MSDTELDADMDQFPTPDDVDSAEPDNDESDAADVVVPEDMQGDE